MANALKLVLVAVIGVLAPMTEAQTETPKTAIEQVKGNVYRYSYGEYRSVFMVTDQGLFLTDPIKREAAAHLRAELNKRFDQPIRYLTYSHSHVDHVMGGEELDSPEVSVIAHELAAEDIEWTKVPTALPEITFKDAMTVHLGQNQVHLKYHGTNNGRGSISMHFMPENVLYVVDWIIIGRMPYKNLLGYDIHGMIHSTKEVLETIDFERFVGGHAEMGTKEDVERYLTYLEALYAAVRDGMLAGKKLETLQQEIRLPQYSDLKKYEEWLPLNIQGVYNTLVRTSYFNFRSDIDAQF